jgi:hypothetical protein
MAQDPWHFARTALNKQVGGWGNPVFRAWLMMEKGG